MSDEPRPYGEHPYLIPEAHDPVVTLADLEYEPPTFGLPPSVGELRAAGAELHAARLQADLEARLSAAWRGRLALRISRLYARRRTGR